MICSAPPTSPPRDAAPSRGCRGHRKARYQRSAGVLRRRAARRPRLGQPEEAEGVAADACGVERPKGDGVRLLGEEASLACFWSVFHAAPSAELQPPVTQLASAAGGSDGVAFGQSDVPRPGRWRPTTPARPWCSTRWRRRRPPKRLHHCSGAPLSTEERRATTSLAMCGFSYSRAPPSVPRWWSTPAPNDADAGHARCAPKGSVPASCVTALLTSDWQRFDHRCHPDELSVTLSHHQPSGLPGTPPPRRPLPRELPGGCAVHGEQREGGACGRLERRARQIRCARDAAPTRCGLRRRLDGGSGGTGTAVARLAVLESPYEKNKPLTGPLSLCSLTAFRR